MPSSNVLSHLGDFCAPALKPGVEFALRHGFISRAKCYGYEFRLPRTMRGMTALSLIFDCYETKEIALLREHFRPASCIVDIGANIGVMSHIALREKLQLRGHMICVEPNPEVFPVLEENVCAAREAKPGTLLTFYNAALGPEHMQGKHAEFIVRRNLSSGLVLHRKKIEGKRIIDVPLMPMKEILAGISGPWSLVCDAEGGEIDMIENQGSSLQNCEQAVIEFHDSEKTGLPATQADMISRMQGLGFKLEATLQDCCYFSR